VVAYLIRRLVQAVVVVLGVVLVVFLLYRLIPGGEARAVLGQRATPHLIRVFNHANGLTQPLWVQFWHYWLGIFQLHFGYSYTYAEPVWSLIRQRLPKTVLLVACSLVLTLIVALPLGMFQVVHRNRASDHAVTGVAFVLYAMPTFFFGTLLIIWFAFDLHWLPVAPPSGSPAWAVFTNPRAFLMPVLTLSVTSIAGFSRYMRSSVLDALAEDYIRTAHAKGASNRRVLYGHALRNALIPIITLLGLSLPGVVSGAVIVETLFNYPGMGLLVVQAAASDALTVVLATTLVITVAVVIGSLLADILYVIVDPRIRFGGIDG
jgi:peptide/nickel transport system permease protein